MPTLAVITTFPPNRWTAYAKRMLESHIRFWPDNVTLYAYHEGEKPTLEHPKIKFINIEDANPELIKFKQRHKDDPVANGEVDEIPGGVRRDPHAGKNDRGKGSYLWDAVRFAHKTFAVDHAIKTITTDYVLWLDADTYTFRPITTEFVTGLLPEDKLVNFLGRGEKYPECGWVCYNKKHPKITEFMQYWTDLYTKDTIFKELEWHDSYLFWQCVKRIAPNDGVDIGSGKAIVAGPMLDNEKNQLIKKARQAGYVAKPNMGGGVTIFIKEGISKSAIMRQIKDAEEILDSGEADGMPLDNETEMLVQQELTKLKRMLAMNETSLEEIYNQVSEAKDFGFFGNEEGKTGNSIASEAFDDYEVAVERAFQNLVNKVNTAINIGGSGGTDTEVREIMMYHFDKIQDQITTKDFINATFRK